MDVVAVREQLSEQIRAETHLPVLETPSALQATPAVLMGAPRGTYDETLDAQSLMRVNWPLIAVVSKSSPDHLTVLTQLVGTGTERSIPDAIDSAEPTAAAWWRVTEWDTFEEIELGAGSYWASVLNIEIVG